MDIRLHRFLPFTRAEGPGDRACLWVQGCSIHCPGCAVPWTWSTKGGGLVSAGDLADRVLNGPTVQGVTLVGGEPFDQATALAEFARLVRKQGLSVVTFTGYELEQIIAADRDDWLELLRLTDLLLDGPFRVNLADVSRPWVGSKNQRFHFLTDRYRHLEAQLTELPNRLEIRIESDGRIQINGMASSEDLQDLFDSLASEHL